MLCVSVATHRADAAINASSAAQDAPNTPTTAAPAPTIRRLADDAPVNASALRGLVGEVVVEYAGPPLRAKLDQDLTAPILVRVNEVQTNDLPRADSSAGPRRYRIDFIGAVAGVFDLRDAIETRDGLPVADLPPIAVRIVSELSPLHGTDLFRDEPAPFRISSHYRLLAGAVVMAWLAIPAFVLWRRWMRRVPPAAPIVEPPAPTLAEQLRPLVEAAMARGLAVDEQARLELLLIRFWRGRLGLDGLDPAAAISRVRRDPQAGELVRAVERWLHGRGSAEARPREDVAALLAPYRGAAPISEGDGARAWAASPGATAKAISTTAASSSGLSP